MSEAIFSHHSALPDNVSTKGKDGYQSRLEPENLYIMPEAEKYFWTEVIEKQEFEAMLQQALGEMEALLKDVMNFAGGSPTKEFHYTVGLLEKYCLSCLIDADWMDSMLFEESKGMSYDDKIIDEIADRSGRTELFTMFLNRLEEKLQGFRKDDRELNVWRREISDRCKKAGSRKSGIYTLSCPTGAGKTLASMRYALEHCLQADKTQIFYIIPYTSIIDQSAESIKRILKEGEKDELVENSILELHSAKEIDDGGEKQESTESDFWTKRMAEPIIFTTMVRFLNTFLGKGTRNLRPMHQFQNAVLIFDEIQSLSVSHIALFNGVINFLAKICNCTCVLCTATQPLLGKTEKPVYPVRFEEQADLVMLEKEAKKAFARVRAVPLLKPGNGYTVEEIADLLTKKAEQNGNALLIMNTKSAALAVFEEVEKRAGSAFEVLYLSTLLYPKHRKEVIAQIKKHLLEKKKLIVVSTQLVEAGVDFDFQCVIRSLAGLDSIVQAAGRCNREGKEECGEVYIINPSRQLENTVRLPDIEAGKETGYRMIHEFEAEPKRYDNDLFSKEAIEQFFAYFFWARKTQMCYRIKGVTEYSLYDLLSDNRILVGYGVKHEKYQPKPLNQAFKEAAEQFEAIVQNGEAVFVPRKEGHTLWEQIQRQQDINEYKRLLKKAQKYVVNVDKQLFQKLAEKGVLHRDEKMNMYVLNEMYYHEKKGLSSETGETIPLLEW